MSNDKKPCFTFETKTTEAWTYKLSEEEYTRFKHLPTPCAITGFKHKNVNSDINSNETSIKTQN